MFGHPQPRLADVAVPQAVQNLLVGENHALDDIETQNQPQTRWIKKLADRLATEQQGAAARALAMML